MKTLSVASFLVLVGVVAVFVVGASSSRSSTNTFVDDERVIVGKHSWSLIDKDPPTDTLLPIKVALRQQNLLQLEQLFWQVSDTSSAQYGQYLSVEDITALVAPSDEEIKQVLAWILGEADASDAVIEWKLSVNKDYIFVSAPIRLIERLFKVKISQYTQTDERMRGAKSVYRANAKSVFLPEEIQRIVENVYGVVDFPPPLREIKDKAPSKVEEPGGKITPPVIKSLYKINRVGASPQSSQAVAEFEQAYFYPSDVLIFEKMYNLPEQPIAKIIGPNDPENGYLGEASLDTQYIIGVGTNIPSWVFSIGTNGLDLIAWANVVMNTTTPPLIHSISWGSGESGWDKSLMQRVNTEFMKLGLLGMSIFVASGDDGTGNTGWIYCGTFDPTFPGSSPYVTTVGGTYLTGGEIAWSSSGGGFSFLFKRPAYQNAQVTNYLQNGPNMPNSEYFNSAGRGFPDVSALSTNFQVVAANYSGSLSGTSAATPTFAAIVSLLNDARYQAGKKPLGFVNPWLYGLKKVGTDITQGDNQVELCSQGFSATVGWDAISGLGTPDFQVLLQAALALP